MEKKNNGIRYAIAAYGAWGFYPLFWKLLVQVPSMQIVAYRLVWSFVFVAFLVSMKGQMGEVLAVLKQPKLVLPLLASALLLTANWLIYIWAVNSNQIVESSMGYFINPLVSVLLGMIFLREKINFWQSVAIGLAGMGVLYMVIGYGQIPWIALFLAGTFGLYGLIRKVVLVDSLNGLMIETALLFPLVVTYLVYTGRRGENVFFSQGLLTMFLLAATGVLTAYPLIWIVMAAKQLPLKTLGFCQYLAPSLMLVIGVLVYGEPFTPSHRVSFGLIWAALVIYSLSSAGWLQRWSPGKRTDRRQQNAE